MRKVLIIDQILSQYRLDFYNHLREELLAEGVELILV